MKNNRNMAKISDFYCTCCGRRGMPLPREKGKEKEPGHLKKIFCIYCKDYKNMVEVKPKGKYKYEDFFIEYNYGNFKDGQRITPYKQFISQIKQKLEKEAMKYNVRTVYDNEECEQ